LNETFQIKLIKEFNQDFEFYQKSLYFAKIPKNTMNINASSLNQYTFCPRSIYLSKVLKLKAEPTEGQTKGLLGHAVRKELSMRQAKLLGKIEHPDELEIILLQELEQIMLDFPHIYKNMLKDLNYENFISDIKSELLSEIGIISTKLGVMVEELGIRKALELVTPWKAEYYIKSDNLGITGRVDKVMLEETYIPVEIKTGQASDGVWEGDRLQTCAYAMLLEDRFKLKEPIPYGFVEYTRIQERRPVMTTEKLRREVINTRDSIIEILQGKIPEICPHGSGKKCEACGYTERCYEI